MSRYPSCRGRQFASRPAFAVSDLLAVCVCLGMLAGVLLPMAGGGAVGSDDAADTKPDKKTWPSRRLQLRDATQLKGIHQSMLIYAQDFGGKMPLPGLIRRLPIEGQRVPGRGEQDVTQNTTANLYSVCIMYNYFTTDLPISPWERSPNVQAKEDFDWEAYDVANAVYWDDAFKADLDEQSHVSYAHLQFTSKRQAEWGSNMRADYIQLSNRGPRAGKKDPDSITCDDEGNWAGHVVQGDNATYWRTAMTHDDITIEIDGEEKPDNFFADDADDDVLLTFIQSVDKDGNATIQHD